MARKFKAINELELCKPVMNKALLAMLALPAGTCLSLFFGRYALQFLRRLKLGQHIREEGPQSHQSKGGTPTMGGIIFLLPALLLTLLLANFSLHTLVLILGVVLITALGWIDDWQKVVLKNNKGITPRQKMAGQLAIGGGLGLYLMLGIPDFTPVLQIPFTSQQFSLGWFYPLFAMFFFSASTNAVNLTDGLDGLATTLAILSLGAVVSILVLQGGLQNPLLYPGIVLGLSTLGACVGFLWYNSHPAQVFMGDTGSLALGGILAILSMLGGLELWFAIIGLVFVSETLSVIIQVAYFKRTRKRIFRMSPLHHHFELGGWKETQIVNRFGIVGFLLAFGSVFVYYATHLPVTG